MPLPSLLKTCILVLTTITGSAIIYTSVIKHQSQNLTKAQALIQIESRINQYYKVERRADTLYYPTLYKEGNHNSAALIVDSLIKLNNGRGTLAVLRVFETATNYCQKWPYQSNDSINRIAVTDLGSGRGYQVQMGLSLFKDDDYKLDWLELDCGEFGEYFQLPSYTIHEFDDDRLLSWGAMVLKNHSSRGGFGHIEITSIDLGGPNHLEITLRHITQSEKIENYFDEEYPEEMREIEDEMEERLGLDLNVERYLKSDVDYQFNGRQLIITENSSFWYADKVFSKEKGEFVYDTLIPNPEKRFVYDQIFWPAGYVNVE